MIWNKDPIIVSLSKAEDSIITDLDLMVYTDGAGYDLSILLTHVDTGSLTTICISAT